MAEAKKETTEKLTVKQRYEQDLLIDVVAVLLSTLITVGLFYSPLGLLTKLSVFLLVVIFGYNKFSVVQESTAQNVEIFHGFWRSLIQFEGYTFDHVQQHPQKWNVIPGKEPWWHIGGLRWAGPRIITRITWYKFRWQDPQLVGGKEVIVPHEEVINYIPLRDEVYAPPTLVAAETQVEEEKANVDVDFREIARVSNPYLAQYRAPYNWLENVMSYLGTLYLKYVAKRTWADLSSRKGEDILDTLRTESFVSTKLPAWGIDLQQVTVQDVRLPKDFQDAQKAKALQRALAEGRAEELAGTVLAMLAKAHGQTVPEIQKEIGKGDTELKREYLGYFMDLFTREMAIRGKSFLDIRIPGRKNGASDDDLSSLERAALIYAATHDRIPQGKGGDSQPGGGEKKKAEDKKMTRDELAKILKGE